MCKVIAVGNNKGGIGKTTICVNLAAGLAKEGKRVLVIDADSQGHSTISAGYDRILEMKETLSEVMNMLISGEEFDPSYGILHTDRGYDLLPSNIRLAETGMYLVTVNDWEHILSKYIDMVRDSYDFILYDCSPSIGAININVYVSADSVLIPVQIKYFAAMGLEQFIYHVTAISKKYNTNLEIEGVLLSMADTRSNLAKMVRDQIYALYGEKVHIFKKPIPQRISAEACTTDGYSIFEYEPNGAVGQAFQSLTEEVLANE